MLQSGDMLQNRYRVVALLGQGGMGAVYRAWDTRLNVHIALKEMIAQPGLDSSTLAQLREQFRQEATVLARLKHPGLVGVSDFFEERGNAYLVMQYVEGQDLASRLQQYGALPEPDVLALADQLLDALAYCHDEGIIHRDVKPQNVIIRPDGRPVLVDFGLVKLWNPGDPRTRTAMRGMGTPEYAPPEQYEVATSHTDPRSDVYSVGALLYHTLTGQAPPTATLRIASPASFQPPRSLNPSISPRTEAVVLRATELAVENRFRNAREMAAALRGQVPLSGITARRPQVGQAIPPAQREPARHRPTALWVGLGVVGIVSVGLCALAIGGALAFPDFLQGVFGAPTDVPSTEQPVTVVPTPEPTIRQEDATAPPATEPLPTARPTTPPTAPPATVDLSLRWHTIGQSVQHRDLDVATIGDPNGAAVVIIGSIQGDQPNTRVLVSRLIEELDARPRTIPPAVGFHLIPSINPDGLAAGTRRNANNVDLNRNWDSFDWTADPEQPGGMVRGAGGVSPFSEPETRQLADYLLALQRQDARVRVVLWHASQRLTSGEVYPGYTSDGLESHSVEIARRLARATGYALKEDWAPYETTGELIAWCAENGIAAIDVVIPRSLSGSEAGLLDTTINALVEVARFP